MFVTIQPSEPHLVRHRIWNVFHPIVLSFMFSTLFLLFLMVFLWHYVAHSLHPFIGVLIFFLPGVLPYFPTGMLAAFLATGMGSLRGFRRWAFIIVWTLAWGYVQLHGFIPISDFWLQYVQPLLDYV